MSEWVGLDVMDGIGPVAVKRRRPSEDDALLDHEASVLSAIDHSGVVRLVERRTEPTSALVTHFIGTHSLATAPLPGLDDAVGMVAALAHTVAHLHGLGVRHGAIDPSHVLVGPGRQPVLCGFSGATGPGADPDQTPTAADDVAAVGRIITRLIAGHDSLEPIPTRRPRRAASWAGYRQRALLILADHCQADDPASRPSATSLATTIDDLTVDTPRRGHRGTALSRHTTPIAAALAVLGLTAGLIAWNTGPGASPEAGAEGVVLASQPSPTTQAAPTTSAPRHPARSPSRVTTATTTATTTPPTTSITATPGAVRRCAGGGAASGADIDGDGCPDARAVVHGRTVTVGEVDYVLGRRGDRILIGDWSCDGLVTAILVRRDPAAIWHFTEWAPDGETTTATPITGDVDPASVTRRRNAEGCHDLLVRRPGESAPRPLEVRP